MELGSSRATGVLCQRVKYKLSLRCFGNQCKLKLSLKLKLIFVESGNMSLVHFE